MSHADNLIERWENVARISLTQDQKDELRTMLARYATDAIMDSKVALEAGRLSKSVPLPLTEPLVISPVVPYNPADYVGIPPPPIRTG